MKKNLFIAFEGIDGSGKSTQVKLLKEKLSKDGHKIYSTFEPTDSPIGSLIRNIFNRRIETDERAIASLFVADRLDHLLNKTNGIVKKMQEGYTVITDRYYFSSYAYHSATISLDWLIEANSLSANILKPDLNIYIDIDPEISIERLNSERSNIEIYENIENLKIVSKKYKEAFVRLGAVENVFLIDGNNSINDLSNKIFDKVQSMSK
ncbi:dTMP kinase [Pedobacter agri]|uniref:Thymidylate kinase n=1 Tax=Pedobacter agri TaxID=454586 RepID=A0A9X3I9A6_9SPHI|nr:dTMP kinase [Pedobacter agri]MCX3265105.1 dTMP kinase [Pedobacter agri]